MLLSSWNTLAQQEAIWLGELPAALKESSGLLLRGDRFITHNDSGNPPLLFELDTAGLNIIRSVRVLGVDNTDWEALEEDENYFYLGDIGNNQGVRRDLKVLRISKNEFDSSDAVMPEVIAYSYHTQKSFEWDPQSDYDAEAMIVGKDSIWIFTKQWNRQGTEVYSIPKSPGEYEAKLVVSYSPRGLVTDASPIPGEDAFLLLGYTAQLQPFISKVPGKSPSQDFSTQTEKHLLSLGFAQAEGLTVTENGTLFISAEAFSNRLASLPAGIYKLDLATELEQAARADEDEDRK